MDMDWSRVTRLRLWLEYWLGRAEGTFALLFFLALLILLQGYSTRTEVLDILILIVTFTLLGQIFVVLFSPIDWKLVVWTAQRMGKARPNYEEAELQRHLSQLRRYWKWSIQMYSDDLLVLKSASLKARSKDSRATALATLTRGVGLGLRDELIEAAPNDRKKVGEKYARKVMSFFSATKSRETAVRNFLVEYFENLEKGIKQRVLSWEPPENIFLRMESYPNTMRLLYLIVIASVAIVLTLYFGPQILIDFLSR